MQSLEIKELLPKVSFGNRKLPKNMLIFNIPSVLTCPNKTSFCEQYCYAKKAERIYPQVYPARKHNLKLSQSDNFVQLMNTVLFNNRHKFDLVRVHESGDFYSQEYLDKWFRIASMYELIKFIAYTKSFHLDFGKKPSNFVLIASFDESTDVRSKGLYLLKKQYFDNTFTIVSKETKADCIQDCTKCSNCWSSKGLDITVNKH